MTRVLHRICKFSVPGRGVRSPEFLAEVEGPWQVVFLFSFNGGGSEDSKTVILPDLSNKVQAK